MTEKALTGYNSIKMAISADSVKERFTEVLGARAPQFMAGLLNAVYDNSSLRQCDPNSIIIAAMQSAVLDIPIDPNLGLAYLIPYRTRDGHKARFQLGYRGYVQLALRTGLYHRLNATAVYEGEQYTTNRLTGDAEITGSPTSKTAIGYAAYFCLLNGLERYEYMSVEDVEAHAKKYSKSWNDPKSAWSTNFNEMALKTVLLRLLRRWGLINTDPGKDGKSFNALGEIEEQGISDDELPDEDGIEDVDDNDLEGEFQTGFATDEFFT